MKSILIPENLDNISEYDKQVLKALAELANKGNLLAIRLIMDYFNKHNIKPVYKLVED